MTSLSGTRKLVVSDGEVERELLFVGRMCVGRAPECEISVNDPRLSRMHAEFVEEEGLARVRDLRSRNGLTLNGQRVTDERLTPGDVVQIAGISIRYVEEAPSPATVTVALAPADADRTIALHGPGVIPSVRDDADGSGSAEASPDDERTAVLPPPAFARTPAASEQSAGTRAEAVAAPAGRIDSAPPGPGGTGASGSASDAGAAGAGDDATRVIPPPAFVSGLAAPGAAGANEVGVAPRGAVGPSAGAPAEVSPRDDATRVIPPPAFARGDAGASSPSSAAPRSSATTRGGEGVATPAGAAAPARRPSRMAFSWPGRLIIRALVLGLVVWAISAWPQVMLLNRVIAANDSARARAVAMWLASEAARAFEAGQGLGTAADAVLAYPGVEGAVIVDRASGDVLAPGRRGTETITRIRDLNAAPADIVTLRGMVIGDRVEVAAPVVTRDGRRPAVAWVTFRQRPPAEATSVGPILAMSLLFALAASLLVAALIRRMTLAAMTRLRDDVELAISGRLDAVDDPLGAKPMREAVDVVNYLITRYRATPAARALGERGGMPASAGAGEAAAVGRAGASAGAAVRAGYDLGADAADGAHTPGGARSTGAAGGTHGVGSAPGAGSVPGAGSASGGGSGSAPGADGAHGVGSVPGAGSPPRAGNGSGAGSGGAGGGANSGGGSTGHAVRGSASALGLPAGINPGEACWVTTAAFVVSEATPACEGVLGIRPDVVRGQHLVDAAADQAVADAILEALGALPPSGESRSRIAAGGGRPRAIQIIMRRDGSDRPVTVRFVPEGA